MKTIIEIRYDKLGELCVQNRILQGNKEKCAVSASLFWTNKINNKTYVGSSINLSKRFVKYFNRDALSKPRMLINLALLKCGRNKFRLDIIEYCSLKNVIERDAILRIATQFYLDNLKPYYNILRHAGSSYGYTHNETSILKITRRTVSDASLAKMRTRVQTKETKNKIRKSIATPVLVVNINTNEKSICLPKLKAGLVLGVSDSTIGRYIRSGKVLLDKFLLLSTDILSATKD